MKKMVIFGTSSFAQFAHYGFSRHGYQIAGFTVHKKFLKDTVCLGLPVVAFEEIKTSFPPSDFEIFIAVGIGDNNRLRESCMNEAIQKGYQIARGVSGKASVPDDMNLAPNTMIMDFVSIGPGATVGSNVILWPYTCIGPWTHVESNCWLVGPYIGESARVGQNTFIGCNATIAPNVKIGNYNIIGAGAVVLTDTKDHQVVKASKSKISRVPSSRWAKILD